MGGVVCMDSREDSFTAIFRETEHVTKTKRKNYLETRNRLTGDLDAGVFK